MHHSRLAHHDGSELYVSERHPRLGQAVELRVRVSDALDADGVHLRWMPDGDPHHAPCAPARGGADGESWWSVSVPMSNETLSYRFLLDTPSGPRWLNGSGLHPHEVPDRDDFRITTHPAPPDWAEGAVVYQVFPDRFAASESRPAPTPPWGVASAWHEPLLPPLAGGTEQLYGGSLWGVAERLDHVERLGAQVLYLTPFFPAESNHRYDATTFDHVDPLLGGDEALAALTEGARARGIRVLGDLTLNHTGSGHEWFRAAQADPTSVEASFYYIDPDDPARYASFWDIPSLPKLDHRSAELRRRLYDGPDSVVARYVRDLGLSGWRIDVAQSAGHHADHDLNALCARLTRRTLDAVAPGSLLVAEHQFDATESLAGDGWHGTMAYAAFARPVWSWLGADTHRHWGVPGRPPRYDGPAMAGVMDRFNGSLPWSARVHSMTVLDSHDTARAKSVLGDVGQRVATVMELTVPGMPMIFAGAEVGVVGENLDAARKPFPWEAAGQDADLLEFHRALVALRREHRALSHGGFRWLSVAPDAVTYERAARGDTVVVSVDRTGAAVPAPAGATVLLAGPGYGIWRIS